MTFFTTLEPTIQKFIWKHKRARSATAVLRNRNHLGDFGQYSKAMVIKIVCSWYQNRHRAIWTRIHNLELNADTYSQLIFSKGGKNVKGEKDGLFSKWWLENGTAT